MERLLLDFFNTALNRCSKVLSASIKPVPSADGPEVEFEFRFTTDTSRYGTPELSRRSWFAAKKWVVEQAIKEQIGDKLQVVTATITDTVESMEAPRSKLGNRVTTRKVIVHNVTGTDKALEYLQDQKLKPNKNTWKGNYFAEKETLSLSISANTKEVDLYDDNFGIRAGLSFEKRIPQLPSFHAENIRKRQRTSYWMRILDNKPLFRFDFTVIEDKSGDLTFEFEVEILHGLTFLVGPSNKDNLDFFYRLMFNLISVLQASKAIYTLTERKEKIMAVNKYLGASRDRPYLSLEDIPQPRNLKFSDLVWGNLVGGPYTYCISVKADGHRRLFYIDKTGFWLLAPQTICNLMIRRFSEDKFGSTEAERTKNKGKIGFNAFLDMYNGTLFDVESVPPENQVPANSYTFMIIIFDLIVLQGGQSQDWANNYLNRYAEINQTELPHNEEAPKSFISDYRAMERDLRNEYSDIQSIHIEVKEVRPTVEDGPYFVEQPKMIKVTSRDGTETLKYAPSRISFGWPPAEALFKNVDFLFRSYNKSDNTQGSGPKYLTDGLIFTPVNTAYYPTPTLLPLAQRTANLVPEVLKWKPDSQFTTDYAVVGRKLYSWQPLKPFVYGKKTYTIDDLDLGSYKLKDLEGIILVQAERDKLRVIKKAPEKSKPSSATVAQQHSQFYIRLALNPLPHAYSPDKERLEKDWTPQILVLEGSLVPFYGTSFIPFDSETEVDWSHPLLQNLPNQTIVEFSWQKDPVDEDTGKFIPVRIREEKPAPNDFEIAEEIWKMLHDPITAGVLTGDDWSLQRKYFTRIKRELYQMAIGNRRNLRVLVSGGGRGGEAHMLRNRASEVYWIEPDSENWARLEGRVRGENYKSKIFKMKTEDFPLSQVERGSFDLVVSMLSITFFDQTALTKFYRLVDHALKPGGKLIIFSINGDAVREVFHPAFGPPRPKMPLILGQVSLEDFGDYFVTKYPKGIGQLASGQKEYYFSFFSLSKELFGYDREHLFRARGEPFLKSEQWKFASLFTACIMSKKERQSYAKRFEKASNSLFLASGLEVTEQEQEEETEKIREDNVLPLTLGKIEFRRIPQGRFWQALLTAFSPSASEAYARGKQHIFERKLREELAEYVYEIAGMDDPPEWLEEYSDTDIVDFVTVLGSDVDYPEDSEVEPLKPEEDLPEKDVKESLWSSKIWNSYLSNFSAKDTRKLKVLSLLSQLLGLNILIYKIIKGLPQVINEIIDADYRTVVLFQSEEGFDIIAELDLESEPPLYRTFFAVSAPESAGERYFRRALGLSTSTVNTPNKSPMKK